jgi:phage replication initiation protein
LKSGLHLFSIKKGGMEDKMEQKEFTKELKNKRLASGLSQGQLAQLLHISRYSINRFENRKANAGKETQNRILRCLNYYTSERPFYLLIDCLYAFPQQTQDRSFVRC